MLIAVAPLPQAVADESFSLVSSEDHLDTALMRAGDRLVLMMAGTTWCEKSRHMVQHVKVGEDITSLNMQNAFVPRLLE